MGDNFPAIDLGAGRTVRSVQAGQTGACAILDDGSVKCWGSGRCGQLGTGTFNVDSNHLGDEAGEMGDALLPVDLGSGRTAVSLTGSAWGYCAALDNGLMKCWGYNANGELGIGDKESRGDDPGEMGDALPYIDLGFGRTISGVTSAPSPVPTFVPTESPTPVPSYSPTFVPTESPTEFPTPVPTVKLLARLFLSVQHPRLFLLTEPNHILSLPRIVFTGKPDACSDEVPNPRALGKIPDAVGNEGEVWLK
jgi:hypothetical protein